MSWSNKKPASSKDNRRSWSEWTVDHEKGGHKRHRINSAGSYIFEHRPAQPPDTSRIQLSYAAESSRPSQYFDPISAISQGLSNTSLNPTHIQTQDQTTDKEAADPHFKVHNAWEFKYGRVFKVLWSEPKGTGGGGNGSNSSQGTVVSFVDESGNKAHTKVRRFVIIRPVVGHCVCLAINTYGGRGCSKPGVYAAHHTVVYSGKEAYYLPGEKSKGLTRNPIKVSCQSRHKLDKFSRLNYAKPYTVEYNVKVWFIGEVAGKCLDQLAKDYNSVNPLISETHDSMEESSEETLAGLQPIQQPFSPYQAGQSIPYQDSYIPDHQGQVLSSSLPTFPTNPLSQRYARGMQPSQGPPDPAISYASPVGRLNPGTGFGGTQTHLQGAYHWRNAHSQQTGGEAYRTMNTLYASAHPLQPSYYENGAYEQQGESSASGQSDCYALSSSGAGAQYHYHQPARGDGEGTNQYPTQEQRNTSTYPAQEDPNAPLADLYSSN